jgi:hypothetical protein
MAEWHYFGISIALFFFASFLLSSVIVYRNSISGILKNIFAHLAWVLIWIPSFFISFKLVLFIPAAWLGYCLVQYERKNMKIKAAQASA